MQLPPVTRGYLVLAFITTVMCSLEVRKSFPSCGYYLQGGCAHHNILTYDVLHDQGCERVAGHWGSAPVLQLSSDMPGAVLESFHMLPVLRAFQCGPSSLHQSREVSQWVLW